MELNLLTFHSRFPDEDACYGYIVKWLWPNGVVCPHCGSLSVYACKTRRIYKCKDCRRQFSALGRSIFKDTHLPFRVWVMALYLVTSEGASSNDLSRKLGITQKSAWFLYLRIQEVMKDNGIQLSGNVQIDETYYGAKSRGRSTARYSKKFAIIGGVESRLFGKAVFMVVKQPDATVAMQFIRNHIKPGTVVQTDESRIYGNLRYQYEHATVNHSQHQYVSEDVTSNKIENNWMHAKRLLKGRHIRVSGKHLSTYICGGFQFRYNTRGLTAEQRIEQWFIQARSTPPLTYSQLKAKQAVKPLALRGWARKRAGLPV